MLSPQLHKLTILEKRYAIDILLLLLEKGPTKKSDLYTALTTNTDPVASRLDELKNLGLLTETRIKEDRWVSRLVELTDRGKRLSKALLEAENIINES